MIIDAILDRKDGVPYCPHRFYNYVTEEEDVFNFKTFSISRAMDTGSEEDVKRNICAYIDECDYNPLIKNFVNSVNWI